MPALCCLGPGHSRHSVGIDIQIRLDGECSGRSGVRKPRRRTIARRRRGESRLRGYRRHPAYGPAPSGLLLWIARSQQKETSRQALLVPTPNEPLFGRVMSDKIALNREVGRQVRTAVPRNFAYRSNSTHICAMTAYLSVLDSAPFLRRTRPF